jgi:hypothetical protein
MAKVDHKPTQNERIISYLNEFGSITWLEAARDLGIARLASRICDLRKRGYEIESEFVTVKNRWGEDCPIKKYYFAS